MSNRVAFVSGGVVKNVAVGNERFASRAGGLVCGDAVSPGWLYDGQEFAPPPTSEPPEVEPGLPVVTRYQFATEYLTAAENDAWLGLLDEARAVAPADRTQTQKDQLRTYNHFELAGAVDFNTDATQAAIYALFQWGVLTQERADALAAATPIA